jgi:MoCo/4Fe-4S cofactor protein with predicted Tat translocation signal
LLNVPSIEHHVTGQQYWRSLAELAEDPASRAGADQEFPGADPNDPSSPSRRNFLKIMGASVALAGLTLDGCRRWPQEKLAPYSSAPRGRIPGVPEQYASAWELGGVASGLLVTSFDGRPIKVEGNPSHPYSQTDRDPTSGQFRSGSADAFAQASVLELYDHPDRSRTVFRRREGQQEESSWETFLSTAREKLEELKGSGEGIAILSEATASPTLLDMRARFIKDFPKAQWFEYEPISHDNLVAGTKLATGTACRPVLHLDKASAVVLIDADLIGMHPAHTRYASDWADRRRQAINDPKNVAMSRVYIAESTFSLTGTIADVRIGAKPDRMFAILATIAAKLGIAGAPSVTLEPELTAFATIAAADLQKAGSAGLVACGQILSPEAHALAFAINSHLGANGTTITYVTDPVLDRQTHEWDIRDLSGKMFAGEVEILLILGGNPVFDAPADKEFGKNVKKQVPLSIHLSNYNNETSQACTWHLPRAHYLESWGDARAWDGSATIIQPLIEPMFGGKTPAELLAMLLGDAVQSGEELVRRTWMARDGLLDNTGMNSIQGFRLAMERGVLENSAWTTATPELKATSFGKVPEPSDGLTIRFQADPHVYDGRFANNGWLQETPDNISKLVWDNAAMFSKADADRLGIATNDLVKIQLPGTGTEEEPPSLEIAACVLPGQPVGVIGLTLGYGRTTGGHIATDTGKNTYVLRDSKSPGFITGVQVIKSGGTYELVMQQLEQAIATAGVGVGAYDERIGKEKYEGAKIIHEGTFADYAKDPASLQGGPRSFKLELYEPPIHNAQGQAFTGDAASPHAWGMAVDLASCIGCNACAVACQAENNIPIVGKFQSSKHREMNWIRIDRYFKGEAENPEVVYQPMMCQHCENAPCEQVCPVGATMHDSEGLNVMVYNRCIGTRYCSNNCPYKVRRFNYLDFHSQDPMETIPVPYLNIPDQQQLEQVDEIKRMVYNPDVSVRMRGVMEKCTFCVQRIHRATIAERAQGKDIVDGEIMTACQQACPTQAIIFGNLMDTNSRVYKLQNDARAYSVLNQELNTRPRTRYLAKVSNPAESTAAEPAVG